MPGSTIVRNRFTERIPTGHRRGAGLYAHRELCVERGGAQGSGGAGLPPQEQGRLEEIFTFRTPTGEPYPSYRLYPEIESGFGFTNRFGWRSRQIPAEKPPNVVRIGMLGDSTTNAYPGLVEHWLNLWAVRRNLGVRFEIANAARPSTGAHDAAAILDYELGSIPDYVVIYGFGNGIYVADALIDLPPGIVKGRPPAPAFRTCDRAQRTTGGWSRYRDGLRRRISAPPHPRSAQWQSLGGASQADDTDSVSARHC